MYGMYVFMLTYIAAACVWDVCVYVDLFLDSSIASLPKLPLSRCNNDTQRGC